METNIVDTLLNYGAIGLVLILLVTRMLVTKWHLDDIAKEKENWRLVAEREMEARVKMENATTTSLDQGQLAINLLRELKNSGPEGREVPRVLDR